MALEQMVIVLAYCLAGIANQFAMWIIRKYHENKPLGMQTTLTKVTVLYSNRIRICVSI